MYSFMYVYIYTHIYIYVYASSPPQELLEKATGPIKEGFVDKAYTLKAIVLLVLKGE